MKITIKMDTENDAFQENTFAEVARILKEAADNIKVGAWPETLRDHNGNRVGEIYYHHS